MAKIQENSVVRKFRTTASDWKSYSPKNVKNLCKTAPKNVKLIVLLEYVSVLKADNNERS